MTLRQTEGHIYSSERRLKSNHSPPSIEPLRLVPESSEGVSLLMKSRESKSDSFSTSSTSSDESVVKGEKSTSELLEGGVQGGPSRTYSKL